ncbi:MAG: S-layer homology domain-containing protein [Synergistaceae bacterium]|nr:S-layer homology domain-containing protein [Synergistaceae bacterium]
MKKILIAVFIVIIVFATKTFAASNPFTDVPAGHWTYDAVALLASRGVVSGYQDGQYKGGHLATRYEMASVVARVLAKIDLEKASNEDLTLVKKLVSEFRDELNSLGVQLTDIEKKVTGLEKWHKGFRVRGNFWIDAEFSGSDQHTTQPYWAFNRARIFIDKQIDEDTAFQMRFNKEGLDGKGTTFKVDRLWFSTKLPWNIKGKFGYQTNDWDREYKLVGIKYGGWGYEDVFWSDLRFMGFDFRKDFGKFDFDFYVGRNTQVIDTIKTGDWTDQVYMTYGAKLSYKSEKLKLGLFGRYAKFDGSLKGRDSGSVTCQLDQANVINYGVYAYWKILNGLEIKGTFNHQQFQGIEKGLDKDGDPEISYKNSDYWQVIAEADQSLLKLFSLWVQYGQVGEGFLHNPSAFFAIGYQSPLYNFGGKFGFAVYNYTFFKVGIHRDFTEKLKAFAMYERFDNRDETDIDNTINYTFGFKYQYSPAIAFQLQYDWRDYGHGKDQDELCFGQESVFRFRTILSF